MSKFSTKYYKVKSYLEVIIQLEKVGHVAVMQDLLNGRKSINKVDN